MCVFDKHGSKDAKIDAPSEPGTQTITAAGDQFRREKIWVALLAAESAHAYVRSEDWGKILLSSGRCHSGPSGVSIYASKRLIDSWDMPASESGGPTSNQAGSGGGPIVSYGQPVCARYRSRTSALDRRIGALAKRQRGHCRHLSYPVVRSRGQGYLQPLKNKALQFHGPGSPLFRRFRPQ